MTSSKSWRGPRVVIGLIAATLSLVYFATLVWGPDTEKEDTKNYLKELGDEPKVEVAGRQPVEIDDSELGILIPLHEAPKLSSAQRAVENDLRGTSLAHEVTLRSAGLREDEVHRVEFLVRDSSSLEALSGARIEVSRAGGSRSVVAELCANEDGIGKVHRVPRAQYRFQVQAAGYHPTEPTFVEVPVDGSRFIIDLQPAAQVVGVMEDRAGQVVSRGLLHLCLEGSTEVLWVEPDAQGRFFSPPLQEGSWHLAWLTDRQAQPLAGMTATLELPAGQRSLLEVIIPSGEAQEPSRPVGIRLAQVTP